MFIISIISKTLYTIILAGGTVIEKKFNKDTKNIIKENEKLLFKILKRNKDSEIGIKFGFRNIKNIEDFKTLVPITDYKYYENYINRMAKGEKNILTSQKVEYFGHTSGTTGKQKLIPCTKSAGRSGAKYMVLLMNKFCYNNFKNSWNFGKGLIIADIVMTTYTEGGQPICSATSGGMKGIKNILPYIYTSPIEVMEVKDKYTQLYLHLLFSLEERSLMYISGVFISSILDLFRTLEEKNKELIHDIRRGTITSKIKLDENIRKKLNKYLSPNAARADFIEKEFKKGIKGIVKRIWPKLIFISTVTGGNFSIYDGKVNYYTNSIPIYSAAYASTEAMIGINPYIDKIRYVIIPDTAFYEFIKEEDMEKHNPRVYGIGEIQKNKNYEIVITNQAGLYRYRLGDVVRITGFYNKTPEIEFLYRKNQALNMVSEKTTEEHLTSAMKNIIKKMNLDLIDYTTVPDNSISPGRYCFYFELKNSIRKNKLFEIEKVLDEELRKSNLAYDRARNNFKLGRAKVKLVKEKSFSIIKDILMGKGISKSQLKIPRVMNNHEKLLEFLESKKI